MAKKVLKHLSHSPPPVDENETKLTGPKSKVTFKLNERMARVAMWINQVGFCVMFRVL